MEYIIYNGSKIILNYKSIINHNRTPSQEKSQARKGREGRKWKGRGGQGDGGKQSQGFLHLAPMGSSNQVSLICARRPYLAGLHIKQSHLQSLFSQQHEV